MTNENEARKVEMEYRGFCQHYTGIVRSMSDKMYNWAFTLNTGALAGTIAFMGTKEIILFSPLIVFICGIISIVISALCERHRFSKRSNLLENNFKKLIKGDGITTAEEFRDKLSPKIKFFDTITRCSEKLSWALFIIGSVLFYFYIK